MELASLADVESLLGRPLEDPSETARVPGLLTQAQALIESYTRRPIVEPVPELIRVVAAQMVANAVNVPKDAGMYESQQVSAGPFAVNHKFSAASSSGSVWLTAQLKAMLSGFRSSMVSVPVNSERSL